MGLRLRRLKQTGTLKSILIIVIIIITVLSGYFGLIVGLNNPIPFRVVESGSMCIPYDGDCDGWSHPFALTLHKGDIIIIQGVDPKDLNTNYPNSDIIVYKKPTNLTATPIVHRIVASYEVNGTLYFQTKGDGNGTPWPAPVNPREYDSNSGIILTAGEGVPADLVEGRVVMRIPYFGWVTLILQKNSWIAPLFVIVIMLVVFLEFIMPVIKSRREMKVRNL